MELDLDGLRTLSPVECIERLASSRIGRVALSENALPTIMAVFYDVKGSAISFSGSGGLLTAAAQRGDIVCFEADHANPSETEFWSVVVVGKLEVEHGVSDAQRGFPADRVCLPMTIMSGREG